MRERLFAWGLKPAFCRNTYLAEPVSGRAQKTQRFDKVDGKWTIRSTAPFAL